MAGTPKNDKRFSLQDYEGIVHVCEDTLERYQKGRIEKKDVDAIMSIVTVSRQTLSDKSRYSKAKNPVVGTSITTPQGVDSAGPFGIFTSGVQ